VRWPAVKQTFWRGIETVDNVFSFNSLTLTRLMQSWLAQWVHLSILWSSSSLLSERLQWDGHGSIFCELSACMHGKGILQSFKILLCSILKTYQLCSFCFSAWQLKFLKLIESKNQNKKWRQVLLGEGYSILWNFNGVLIISIWAIWIWRFKFIKNQAKKEAADSSPLPNQ
jgi:hypothetical protein